MERIFIFIFCSRNKSIKKSKRSTIREREILKQRNRPNTREINVYIVVKESQPSLYNPFFGGGGGGEPRAKTQDFVLVVD